MQLGTTIQSGFYDLLMHKSGSKFWYFVTVYINDVVFYLVILYLQLVMLACFKI